MLEFVVFQVLDNRSHFILYIFLCRFRNHFLLVCKVFRSEDFT